MSDHLPIVIGLGEVLWDVFPDSKRPGGAPANVAFQANQLGNRGLVLSAVGGDELGRELLEQLQQKGLDVSLVRRDSTHPTGRVTVDLSDEGHPDYIIHEEVAWDYLNADENWLDAAGRAAAVAFGTLAQRNDQSRESIHKVLTACPDECLIVYDVNLRQNWYEAAWMERSLDAADIVKLNREEAAVLANLLQIDAAAADLVGFADALLSRFDRLKLICVTRAEDGCLLVTQDETADVPGTPIDVVDAVGAGDAFTAALITARLDGWPLETTAKFANAVGGLVACHAGAMPDLRQQMGALLRTWSPE
jgi:fructokinase